MISGVFSSKDGQMPPNKSKKAAKFAAFFL